MVNWLIKLLGGLTEDDIDFQFEVDFLREQVKAKDQEIARLTNLMLTRAGFLSVGEVNSASSQGPLQPINRKPSWPQRQRELEKEDARKFADEIERRWKAKPGAVSTGTEGNEPIPS